MTDPHADASPEDRGLALPAGYSIFPNDLKERIRTAQVRAAVSVNRELVLLSWQIGRRILAAQEEEGWGTQVVPRLSADRSTAFPEIKGFSPRNLDYMRAFAKAWPEEPWRTAGAGTCWRCRSRPACTSVWDLRRPTAPPPFPRRNPIWG